MKLCPDCGFENKDSCKFCIHCGAPLAAVEIPAVNTDPLDTDLIRPAEQEEPVVEAPVSDFPGFNEAAPEAPAEEFFDTAAPAAPEAPVYSEPAPAAPAKSYVPGYDRRQLRLKDVLRSGKARTIAICFTLLLVISIAISVAPAFLTSYIGKVADTAIDAIPMDELGDFIAETIEDVTDGEYTFVMPNMDDINKAVSTATGVSIASTIISTITGNIVPLLVMLSMWLIYGSASKNSVPCCGTTGLTILKVFEILRLIFVCLLVAITATVLGVYSYLMSSSESGIGTGFWITCGVIAFIYLLIILYYAGTIRSLSIFTAVAEGRAYKGKVSLYASIIYTLRGIFGILGVIGTAMFTIVPLFMDELRFLSLIGLAMLIPSLISVIRDFDIGSLLRQARKALAE